jgi:flagellar biosynthesis/type III secretory pathway protein FliH
VGREAETTMLTLADKIRNEGRDEGFNDGRKAGFNDGRNEGFSDGRNEERRALVLHLLARRFGPLPPETEERVAKAKMEELQEWAMRVLDARSLDEVFSPS